MAVQQKTTKVLLPLSPYHRVSFLCPKQAAKLVLEDFFSSYGPHLSGALSSASSSASAPVPRPSTPTNKVNVVRQPLFPASSKQEFKVRETRGQGLNSTSVTDSILFPLQDAKSPSACRRNNFNSFRAKTLPEMEAAAAAEVKQQPRPAAAAATAGAAGDAGAKAVKDGKQSKKIFSKLSFVPLFCVALFLLKHLQKERGKHAFLGKIISQRGASFVS